MENIKVKVELLDSPLDICILRYWDIQKLSALKDGDIIEFSNLKEVGKFANYLLSLKLYEAFEDDYHIDVWSWFGGAYDDYDIKLVFCKKYHGF